jgi:AcrR family transcriptional regulator
MTKAALKRDALWGQTPASQKRRQDILLAAKRVFFESGYQIASIDRIAEAAGTTKRTVYDHFGSKEGLFAKVAALACRQFVELLPTADSLPEAPREGLRIFAARVRELVSAPEAVRFQRLVIAEAERRPALGRAFYEIAFQGAERVLTDYIEACVEQGRLKPHDSAVSARIILDLAANTPRLRGLMGLQDVAHDQLGQKAFDQAVDLLVNNFASLQRTG